MEAKYHPIMRESHRKTEMLKQYGFKLMQNLKAIEDELEEIKEECSSPSIMMGNIKNILNSYEIMLLQFAQCCEVIDLKVFGKSIMKMFIQKISIIKWILSHYFTNLKALEKEKRGRSNIEMKSVRKKMNSYSENSFSESDFYRFKQANRFMAEDLQIQLNKFQTQQQQQIPPETERALEKILEMQESVLKIEPSNTEELIREASKALNKKNQYLQNFISMRNETMKNTIQDLKVFKIEDNSKEKIDIVVKRLYEIFTNYISLVEKNKKEKLVNSECQVNIQILNKEESKIETRLTQAKSEIKKLNQSLENQKMKEECLEKLLKEKSDKFELDMMRMRMELTNLKREKEDKQEKYLKGPNQMILTHQYKKSEVLEKNESQIQESMKKRKSELIVKNGNEKKSIYTKSKKYRRLVEDEQLQIRDKDTFSSKKAHTEKQIKGENTFIKGKNCQILSGFFKINILPTVAKKKCQKPVKNQIQKVVSVSIEPSIHKSVKKLQKIVSNKAIETYPCENQSSKQNLIKRPVTLKKSMKKQTQSVQIHLQPQVQEKQEKQALHSLSYECGKKRKAPFELNCGRLTTEKNDDKNEKQTSKQKKIRKYILKFPQGGLKFTRTDLDGLFFNEQKALEYEFVNYSLVSFKKNYETMDLGRTSNHRQRLTLFKDKKNEDERLIYLLIRHLWAIKRLYNDNYERIRNFLRFPHSCINKNKDEEWIKLTQQESQLTFPEVRKIYYRLKKIHQKCKKDERQTCEHLRVFFSKIGVF